MEIKVNVADYTQKWLVLKKMRGTPYFYRGPRYTVTSCSATDAFVFDKKEEADAKAAELTAKKTGYRFRVDSASKYFVNNFRLQSTSYYSNEPLAISITAERLSVKQATTYKPHTIDLNAKRDELLNQILNTKTSVAKNLETKKVELQNAVKRYNDEIASYENKLKEFDGVIEQAKTTDFNKIIEPFITSTDRNVAVLFGKKEKPKTLQNQGSMMMLPLKTP